MSSKDVLVEMKDLAAQQVAKFEQAIQEYDIEIKAAEDKGYAQALADQQIPADQKIYTEEDLQNELNPLKAQIAALQVQIDAIPSKVQESVDAAKVALKASFKEKLAAQQAVESPSEAALDAEIDAL